MCCHEMIFSLGSFFELRDTTASKHELVIFEGFRGAKARARSPGFKYVPLRRPRFDFLVPRKRRFPWEFKWIDNVLNREGIEFFLNTTFEAVTLTIPFLAIVWDLQHRLQPFFPEVSADGEWEKRETFYSQVLERAAFVIVGTKAGKGEVQRFYGTPDEKIRILPHPTPSFALEESATDAEQLAKYKLPRDYIFYPAQFWTHKNHAGIVKAVAHLKRTDNLRLPVVFTGSDQGNERQVRKLVEQMQIEDQVFFLGHVSRETLKALYQNAFAYTHLVQFKTSNCRIRRSGFERTVLADIEFNDIEDIYDCSFLEASINDLKLRGVKPNSVSVESVNAKFSPNN